MHIKILPKHNFGRGAYYITFEDTNTGKEKFMQKFNGRDTFYTNLTLIESAVQTCMPLERIRKNY